MMKHLHSYRHVKINSRRVDKLFDIFSSCNFIFLISFIFNEFYLKQLKGGD